MAIPLMEKRSHQRARVNWKVECMGTPGSQPLIHEGSRLEDYSPSGACFLTMSEVKVGMELTFQVTLPLRMARPLTLKGVIVRVDEDADIGKMFRAAGVRWLANQKIRPDPCDLTSSDSPQAKMTSH